jgi:ribonuclease D
MSLPVYQYVDTWDKVRSVCTYVYGGGYTVFAFDLEGVNLGRNGQVTLLQLAVDETCVFCFDVLLLGPALLGRHYLGPLFMSPHVVKVCFDCRVDGDVLHSQMGVRLSRVYDIQVLYTLLYQSENDRFLKGLRHVLQSSGIIPCPHQLHCVLSAKTKIKQLMSTNVQLFKMRPLTPELLQYCSADVVFLLRMYRVWHHLRQHQHVIDLSMRRLHGFLNRPKEIPSRQMSVLDFCITP